MGDVGEFHGIVSPGQVQNAMPPSDGTIQASSMTRIHIFADESGNFDFSRGKGATQYFILTTVTSADCEFGAQLLELRRRMAWNRLGLNEDFHATENSQAVRDRIFEALQEASFVVDATIFDKPKIGPYYRQQQPYFYHFVWYRHMQRIARVVAAHGDEVLVISSALGTRKSRFQFHRAVSDAVGWLLPSVPHRTAHWSAASDPCLYAADYCGWAIQRKWETGDSRSYNLIAHKIRSEEDAFRTSTQTSTELTSHKKRRAAD